MKNQKTKLWLVLSLGLGLLLLTACGRRQATVPQPTKELQSQKLDVSQAQQQRLLAKQNLLASFVKEKMVTNNGIYTAYSSTSAPDKQPLAQRAFLSESAGLWLQYLVGQGDKQQFASFYRATKATLFQKKAGQFAYRYDPQKKAQAASNAGLDDLRIMRALLLYDLKYHSTKYQQDLNELAANYRKHLVKSQGQIVSFYDTKAKMSARVSPLAYYDFKTLRIIEGQTKKDRQIYRQQLKLVKNGYLGEAFPLYAAEYDGEQGRYSTKNLNTSEALEVLLHLADVHELRPASLAWLKEQVDNQSLKNSYTVSGRVADHNSSAGNYALAALIFAVRGDQRYYERALQLVWQQQVTAQNAELFGALSQPPHEVTYSFNNLLALLATQRSTQEK